MKRFEEWFVLLVYLLVVVLSFVVGYTQGEIHSFHERPIKVEVLK